MRELLIIAFVLACPLMMVLMMRGGHGHSHGAHGHGDGEAATARTAAELRRERDELERLIRKREAEEAQAAPDLIGRR
jgi:hypothetical protein